MLVSYESCVNPCQNLRDLHTLAIQLSVSAAVDIAVNSDLKISCVC